MIIQETNLCLERLTRARLEEVRVGRNAEHVRHQLLDSEIISAGQQSTWFDSLNPSHDFYFVVCIDGRSIGLVFLKGVVRSSAGELIAQHGVFFWELEFHTSLIPLRAEVLLLSFTFDLLAVDLVHTSIKGSNGKSNRLSEFVGMVPTGRDSVADLIHYELPRQRYFERRSELNRVFRDRQVIPLKWDDIELREDEPWVRRFQNSDATNPMA